eukprot:8902690-Pyramimonas_sp.AAC.2
MLYSGISGARLRVEYLEGSGTQDVIQWASEGRRCTVGLLTIRISLLGSYSLAHMYAYGQGGVFDVDVRWLMGKSYSCRGTPAWEQKNKKVRTRIGAASTNKVLVFASARLLKPAATNQVASRCLSSSVLTQSSKYYDSQSGRWMNVPGAAGCASSLLHVHELHTDAVSLSFGHSKVLDTRLYLYVNYMRMLIAFVFVGAKLRQYSDTRHNSGWRNSFLFSARGAFSSARDAHRGWTILCGTVGRGGGGNKKNKVDE